MQKYLTYAAFGWLTFSGTMHFLIDVAAQYLRHKRAPGPETTLYYGLNSAFASGQVFFGLMCFWIAWRQPAFLGERPVAAVCLGAALSWLIISFAFMEYWEPKMNAGIFAALVVIAIIIRR